MATVPAEQQSPPSAPASRTAKISLFSTTYDRNSNMDLHIVSGLPEASEPGAEGVLEAASATREQHQ
jgi:hypothetical protein